MSTASHRLLSRPYSLALLRHLIRKSGLEQEHATARNIPCICAGNVRHRRYVAAIVDTVNINSPGIATHDASQAEPLTAESTRNHAQREVPIPFGSSENPLCPPTADPNGHPAAWGAYLQMFDEVKSQSGFGPQSDDTRKLVDDPRFRNDMSLWTYLLEFRKRHFGDAGVRMIWLAIRKRGLQLPTEGPVAGNLWGIFLRTGFADDDMLREICQYADELYERTGKSWSRFYVSIIQHKILEKRDSVLSWHERLIARHPPSRAAFSKLARNIVRLKGDLGTLKLLLHTEFYTENLTHKIYGNLIPPLLERQDFYTAMEWHLFLVHREDHPPNRKIMEPLIRFFDAYDPPISSQLKKVLILSNVHNPDQASNGFESKTTISREMMNIVHGKTFGIEPKRYNDQLGARWFATTWISLDFAIHAINALGVQEIGPLSLQAIALREAHASGVVRRIEMLKELGISIVDCVFSKAIVFFAGNGETEYLQGLLRSDQHPDSYEDRQLQKNLVAAYARDGDWTRYRLTSAVQIVGSHACPVDRYNFIQQANLVGCNRSAFFKTLEMMRVQRIRFTKETIVNTVKHFLSAPDKRQTPQVHRASLDDFQTLISFLITTMRFGSAVPTRVWRDIIGKLGMLGRLDDVEKLCLWLAAWYNPQNTLRSRFVKKLSPILAIKDDRSIHNRARRNLFSSLIQRKIVELFFIYEPIRLPHHKYFLVDNLVENSAYHYTRGLRLLRQLQDEGVHIRLAVVRNALQHRLAFLYGDKKWYTNRGHILKNQNVTSREDMITQLNLAWGTDILVESQNESDLERGEESKRQPIFDAKSARVS